MSTIPKDELDARLAKLRAAAKEAGFDAILAFSTCKTQANVRWLTGYYTRFAGWQHVSGDEYSMFGSCAALIPVDGEPLLRSDQSWDAPRVAEISPWEDAGSTFALGADIGKVIAQRGYERVGIDNWHLFPVVHYLAMKEAAPAAELVETRLISEVRRVKSPVRDRAAAQGRGGRRRGRDRRHERGQAGGDRARVRARRRNRRAGNGRHGIGAATRSSARPRASAPASACPRGRKCWSAATG